MPWTNTDLTAVEKAIVQSESTVRFADGREITYRSATELLKVRDAIRDSLRAQTGGVRSTLAEFSKD